MVQSANHYEVVAYNSAKDSDNLMHDNAIAKSLGYLGGLVPGVDMLAYLAHLPVERWGLSFIENGELHVKLLKPVYEGDLVTVAITSDEPHRLELKAEVRGEICVEAYASVSKAELLLDIADYLAAPPPDDSDRPAFDRNSLPAGSRIASRPFTFTERDNIEHLESVREKNTIYVNNNVVHPASFSRRLNWSLKDNFRLGPWIHASAHLIMAGIANVGDELVAHARVTNNEIRGSRHRIDLDGVIVANDAKVIARVVHRVYVPSEFNPKTHH
jgi:hypothetical protein